MRSQHHNRLNIRDTSAEPSNLFGDRHLPGREDAEEDAEFNDRLPDDLPELEEAHIPHV